MSRELTVFVRDGCHLCEDMLQELRGRQDTLNFTLETVDINGDPGLETLYGTKVPVLTCSGQEVCHYFLDPVALLRCFEVS